MNRKISRKSQTILYYAVLIAFAAAALLVMGGYIQRRVMGSYKEAGDRFSDGEQSAW
jgi:hypothetical protein